MEKNLKVKIATIALGGLAILIVGAYVHAPLLFRYKYHSGNFTFYSDRFNRDYQNLFDDMIDECRCQPYFNGEKKVRVYFPASKFKYRLITPVNGWKALGINITFGNFSRIVMPGLDIRTKTVRSSSKKFNRRDATSVFVHEYYHSCITKIAAPFNRFRLPSWKEEGLAEYFAGESSYDYEKGLENIRRGIDDGTKSFRYFQYRMAVTRLFDVEGLSYEEILDDKRSWTEILDLEKRNFLTYQ